MYIKLDTDGYNTGFSCIDPIEGYTDVGDSYPDDIFNTAYRYTDGVWELDEEKATALEAQRAEDEKKLETVTSLEDRLSAAESALIELANLMLGGDA